MSGSLLARIVSCFAARVVKRFCGGLFYMSEMSECRKSLCNHWLAPSDKLFNVGNVGNFSEPQSKISDFFRHGFINVGTHNPLLYLLFSLYFRHFRHFRHKNRGLKFWTEREGQKVFGGFHSPSSVSLAKGRHQTRAGVMPRRPCR